jgi:branched-chain amino acid aminotransferase
MGITFKVLPAAKLLPASDRARILANPGFGKVFSEHMAVATWNRGEGWHDAEVRAYGPIPIDPGTSVLHYAQAVFEGLKAYRQRDGHIRAEDGDLPGCQREAIPTIGSKACPA